MKSKLGHPVISHISNLTDRPPAIIYQSVCFSLSRRHSWKTWSTFSNDKWNIDTPTSSSMMILWQKNPSRVDWIWYDWVPWCVASSSAMLLKRLLCLRSFCKSACQWCLWHGRGVFLLWSVSFSYRHWDHWVISVKRDLVDGVHLFSCIPWVFFLVSSWLPMVRVDYT